jgi:hypothetical protein
VGVNGARCLVVANRTLGGERLRQAITDRIDGGRESFYVLVPLAVPAASARAPLPSAQGVADGAAADAAAREEAARRSQHRLNVLLEVIAEARGVAHGEVSSANPVVAVRRVLARATFEEILVSTLPANLSRWMRRDVPSRIARLTDIPVTHIEAR